MMHQSHPHLMSIWQKYCDGRDDWTNKEYSYPLQRDSVNCGVLVLIYIEQVIQLGQVDMNLKTDHDSHEKFRLQFDRLLSSFRSV